jgi:DHA2 family multidrug resistance protein
LQTFLTKREQCHSNGLSVSLFEQATQFAIERLTAYFMSHGVSAMRSPRNKAIIEVALRGPAQAYIIAFSDTFFLLAIVLAIALVATLLLKNPDQIESGGAH